MARKRRPEPLGDERTDARERALLFLYEAHTKGVAARDVLASQVLAPDEMTRELVEGAEDHRERLDRAIAAHAKGWTLARMPIIDLTIMRIAGTGGDAKVTVSFPGYGLKILVAKYAGIKVE